MDARLLRIKELITEKERIDAELDGLLGGAPVRVAKPRPCKACGEIGHRSDKCPNKSASPEAEE